MASVGANAHEQPKWSRRLSWCSYCLRIPAYSCVQLSCLDSGDLCYWPCSCPPLHARLVVGAIVAQHEEDLPVYLIH